MAERIAKGQTKGVQRADIVMTRPEQIVVSCWGVMDMQHAVDAHVTDVIGSGVEWNEEVVGRYLV